MPCWACRERSGAIPLVGTVGDAIATGKPVLRREFAETEQPLPTRTYTVFAEVMEAPIFSFGEIRGVLGVWSRDTGRFGESDLRLIEAGLRQPRLDRAPKRGGLRRASARRGSSARPLRIAAVLSEPLSEQETLDAVAQAAAEALGGGSAAVLRPAGDELELAGSYELADGLAAHLGKPAPSLVTCLRGEGARVSSAPRRRALRQRARGRGGRGGPRLAPGCAAPAARRPGGGLVLVFFEGEQAFGDDQLELAAQVAAAARGALERSELFERERRSPSPRATPRPGGRELAGARSR